MRNLIAVLCVMLASLAHAQDRRNWIAITVADSAGEHEYIGVVNPAVLQNVLNGTYQQPFVLLDQPFYYGNDMRINMISETNNRGTAYGYGDRVYLRIANIVRMLPVDNALIEARMEERRLGSHSPGQ